MVAPFNPPTRFSDAVSSVAASTTTDLTNRYPYYTPSKSKVKEGELDLFPEIPTDADLEKRYKRYQLAKVIVNDVPEDAVRNGFVIRNPNASADDSLDNEFQKVYREFIFSPFLKGLKLKRLFGFSPLFIGYKEGDGADISSPPSGETRPLIGYLLPLKKTLVTLNTSEGMPKVIESIEIHVGKEEDETRTIHPSRFIHFENESLADDREGMSSLLPVWDLLTVQKHADWAIGQDLWRGASGLITLFAAPGATAADATAALESVDNIHAKTRLVLPPGWKAADLSPTRSAYNVRYAYEILVHQIAAGTRVPFFILSPVSYGKRKDALLKEYEGFLFSYQTASLSPLLEQIFKKFQESGQLPEGPFEIFWNAPAESPYDAAAAKYMTGLAKKAEAEAVKIEPKTAGQVSRGAT